MIMIYIIIKSKSLSISYLDFIGFEKCLIKPIYIFSDAWWYFTFIWHDLVFITFISNNRTEIILRQHFYNYDILESYEWRDNALSIVVPLIRKRSLSSFLFVLLLIRTMKCLPHIISLIANHSLMKLSYFFMPCQTIQNKTKFYLETFKNVFLVHSCTAFLSHTRYRLKSFKDC